MGMRKCLDCSESHKEIIYKRLTPVPGNLNMETLFAWYCADSPGNVQGVDFNLFSSMEDALDDSDPWTYCNYNDYGIGFPRDCGPNGRVHHQWNSVWRNGKFNVAFYVWNDNINVGDSIAESPNSSTVPTESILEITTPNHYYYKPAVDLTGISSDSGYVIFSVDASNDALIAIGEDTNHNGPRYEILLGGWHNRRNRIRGANQNPTLGEYFATTLTPNDYCYMPFVESFVDSSAGYVTFAVKAGHSALVAVGEDTNHHGTHYEIILGGWSNSRDKILAWNQGKVLSERMGQSLNSDEYVLFRISWDDTMLKVERSPDYDESTLVQIMKYDRSGEDSYKYDINNVMISTGWGQTGQWRVIGHSDIVE